MVCGGMPFETFHHILIQSPNICGCHAGFSERMIALGSIRLGGIGKAEPLKRELAGLWSRRLTQEHRVVFEVVKNEVRFLQVRHHY